MLSYVLPAAAEDKPPPGPRAAHLRLTLVDGVPDDHAAGSDDGTTTSHSSTLTTPGVGDAPQKTTTVGGVANGKPHQPLKRVSFGSSKGSMVETLIYESPPLHEETSEPASPLPPATATAGGVPSLSNGVANGPMTTTSSSLVAPCQQQSERERVRVTFYQQSRPQEVDLPDENVDPYDSEMTSNDVTMATVTTTSTGQYYDRVDHVVYDRQASIESGWENPFRPGGDLSREADEIVQLIKGGKPITPTSSDAPDINDSPQERNVTTTESPVKKANAPTALASSTPSHNGSAAPPKNDVDVQRGTVVPAGDASQVERVVIKKKPKCECCAIQ